VRLLRNLPIRHRLVVGIVGLLALVLLVSGVVVTRVLRDRLVDDVDAQLGQRVVAAARALRPQGTGLPGNRGGPSPFIEQRAAYVLLDPDGNVVDAIPLGQGDDTEPLPDVAGMRVDPAPQTVGSVDDGGPRYRVRAVGIGIGGATIVAGISLEDVDASVRSARQALFLGGLLTLAATAAVVWFTVRRGLRPIDAMISTAGNIAAGDLTERAPVPDPATEVGQLGTALNTMLDNIEAAIGARAASEDRLRRFAADASHELRTPLTSIRGYAELYRQGATDPDAVALGMDRIEREATRMSELVEDLLLLARLDQGHELRLDTVDLTDVVADAVDAARTVEPARRIDLDLPSVRVTLLGDPGRLRQVLDNLLANVREHTTAATPVTVALTADDTSATIVVRDEGPGMTREEAERAFERFWQGEQTIEHPRHGTGLGLAIVHDLVRTHGGTVGLDTAPGAGTAITIVLPRAGFSGDSQATGSGAGDSPFTVRP
jgi:two-component system OmpR family sensor kinase